MNKTHLLSLATIMVSSALLGCSAGVKMAMPGNGGSSGGGTTGSGGTTGTGGAGNQTGAGGRGGAGLSSGGTGQFDPDAGCASSSTGAVPVPLDLYVVFDTSKSMLETTSAGTTKWEGVKNAMKAFFQDQSSAGLGIGLKYFPAIQSGVAETCLMDSQCGASGPCERRRTCVSPTASTTNVSPLCLSATNCSAGLSECALIKECTPGVSYCAAGANATGTPCPNCLDFQGYCQGRDICASANYATPDVATAALPGAATALAASLDGRTPGGYTPTGPALTGALAYARQRLQSVPDHRIAVVLVTDGLPGGFLSGFPPAACTPADIPGIAAIVGGPQGAGGNPQVLTFVLGVFAPATQAVAQDNLNMIAVAGGTQAAVVIDTSQNVTQRIQEELKRVQSKAIACEYKIPTTGVDFMKVNVNFVNGANSPTQIDPRSGEAACMGTTRGGWYYDSPTAPTKIIACPASCSMFQGDLNGHVDIVLGCPTIIVP